MAGTSQWRASERLAWTDHDGPSRPPGGSHPVLNLALAGVLATVFAGMVFTDTLCPEHRAIVQALGTVALAGCVASAISLARGWAIAPALTAATAAIGVAIGYIDATHDSTRGSLIAAAFAIALAGAAWLLLQQLGLRLWQRQQARPTPAATSSEVLGSEASTVEDLASAALASEVLVPVVSHVDGPRGAGSSANAAQPAEGLRVEAR
jgi:hypothetical protein